LGTRDRFDLLHRVFQRAPHRSSFTRKTKTSRSDPSLESSVATIEYGTCIDRCFQKKSAASLAQGRRLSAPRREPLLAHTPQRGGRLGSRARPLARPRRPRQFGPLLFRPKFELVKKKQGTCLHMPHLYKKKRQTTLSVSRRRRAAVRFRRHISLP
jgi:hypothetical protein